MQTRLLAGFLSLALSSAPAFADEAATALPPVWVPLPDAPPAPSSLERKDPSGARTVISVKERRGEAKETAELVASAAGVQVQDSGGLLQTKSLSIRGASANGVLVYLDGVPLQGSGGMVDLSRIPEAIVDRFEILRGAAGARLGSGGLGGALNIVTRLPSDGASVAAQASYGSFGTITGHLAGSGTLLGGGALLVVHGARSDGDFRYLYDEQPAIDGNALTPRRRENNQALQGGALAKYARALGGGWDLEALAEGTALSRGLPGPVRNPTPDAHEDSRRLTGQLLLRKSFEGGGSLFARTFARADAVGLRGGYYSVPLAQSELVAGGELSGAALFGGRHGVSGGLELSHEGLTVHGGAAADVGWMRLGVNAMDEVLLFDGALTVAPSLRVDLTGPFVGVSPKLGVTWAFADGFEVRANAGQAHRAPSFLELYVAQGQLLPNPELRPERALYADLALGYRAGGAALTAGGFYSLYEDLIAYEYYPPLLVKPYNFAAAQVYGVELEGELSPHPWLCASASYTLLVSQNLKDDPRYYLKELPYRPRHKLSARLSAGPAVARGRVEIQLQSASAMNRTGSPTLPGRAFLNLGVSTRLFAAPEVTASFELKNALDTQGADLTDYALPGRAAFLTVAFALDTHTERSVRP